MFWLRPFLRNTSFLSSLHRVVKYNPVGTLHHVNTYRNICSRATIGTSHGGNRVDPLNVPFHVQSISTLKRRVFKIKKHKKKKRKKRLSRLSIIPWKPPPEDKKITYQMPYKMRRIVKERRRRNKGNRTLRVPRQR